MKGFGIRIIRDMLARPWSRQLKRSGKVYPYSSTRQQTRLLRKLMRITKK